VPVFPLIPAFKSLSDTAIARAYVAVLRCIMLSRVQQTLVFVEAIFVSDGDEGVLCFEGAF